MLGEFQYGMIKVRQSDGQLTPALLWKESWEDSQTHTHFGGETRARE